MRQAAFAVADRNPSYLTMTIAVFRQNAVSIASMNMANAN
jgi:hypothetical protein